MLVHLLITSTYLSIRYKLCTSIPIYVFYCFFVTTQPKCLHKKFMAIRKNILLSKIKVLNLQENKNALSSNL